jgi:microcystin-dependent protein
MSQPWVGELRIFAGNFEPAGWMFCKGQTLPISENETLFQLLGTTYGGDGQETFNLPDLRGRVPIHQGTGPGLTSVVEGEVLGTETVTLTSNQIPVHTHLLGASSNGASSASPVGGVPAAASSDVLWGRGTTLETMQTSGSAGGSQPHSNMQPYLCINYIISLFGIFPSTS